MKTNNLDVQIEFIKTFGEDGEANASISTNPNFRWAKVRVCDDQPNANNQRIPVEEFENLISTGILTPIKMAEGKIAGHAEAKGRPVGVIHSMKAENNYLDALVAFWTRERPDDIAALEKMYSEGNPPNVSWEIGYSDSEISDGIETLKGVQFNGLAIVQNPAYRGRTKVFAMAETEDENNTLEESNSMDELEELKTKFDSLTKTLEEKEAEILALQERLNASETERTSLAEFKEKVEKEAKDLEKLSAIKEKFVAAGVEKDETYFDSNREMLLGLAETTLDFMLQEMVSFKTAQAELKETKLPNVNFSKGDVEDYSDPKVLGRALRNQNKKELK